MSYLKVLFWKAYYYFKPLDLTKASSTSFIRYWARVNGVKVTDVIVTKSYGKNNFKEFRGYASEYARDHDLYEQVQKQDKLVINVPNPLKKR